MLQASCIYLGLISPCPETYHPSTRPEDLSPSAQWQVSSQQKNTQNIPPDWRFPYRFHKPPYKYEASLIPSALSRVVRPTVAPPCLKKGNLFLLRSSFLFCLAGTMPYIFGAETGRGRGTRLTLCLTLPPSHCFPLFPGVQERRHPWAHFSARALRFPSGTPSAFVSGASLVLRLYWCFAYPKASALPPFLSLCADLQNREFLPFDCSTCNTPLWPAPRLR